MSDRPVFGETAPLATGSASASDPAVCEALAHTSGYRAKAPRSVAGQYEITLWWPGDDIGRQRAGAVLKAIGRDK